MSKAINPIMVGSSQNDQDGITWKINVNQGNRNSYPIAEKTFPVQDDKKPIKPWPSLPPPLDPHIPTDRYMNESSTSSSQIELRSGRVVRQTSRGRQPRRGLRSGSAPPIPGTHELPKSSPARSETMGDPIDEQVPPIDEGELPLSHYDEIKI
ncbi:hypothetical protein M0R45_036325 [Rubus argutus]|uniref:Uncharacterized protein n=1 Tax=Rubus argutus TaxID=59490 RepID=A0AAW1VVS3_RUBAR